MLFVAVDHNILITVPCITLGQHWSVTGSVNTLGQQWSVTRPIITLSQHRSDITMGEHWVGWLKELSSRLQQDGREVGVELEVSFVVELEQCWTVGVQLLQM